MKKIEKLNEYIKKNIELFEEEIYSPIDDPETKKIYAGMPDLETEEEAAERIVDFNEQRKENKTSKIKQRNS